MGLHFPEGVSHIHFSNNGYRRKRLPGTMDEDGNGNASMIAGKIASKYLHIYDDFAGLNWRECLDGGGLLGRIPRQISEERAREIGSRLHNLQSIYDHHLRHSHLEMQDGRLKAFRACITIPLHLMRIVELLSHFYQRHILANRGRRRQKNIVGGHGGARGGREGSPIFLARFRMAPGYGERLAKSLLEQYTVIDTVELHVPRGLGFHMRPATLVAKVAATLRNHTASLRGWSGIRRSQRFEPQYCRGLYFAREV